MSKRKKELGSEYKAIKFITELSIDKASQVLSKLLKTGCKIELSDAALYDITDFSQQMFEKNEEIAGAMTDLIGDASFKFLFWVAIEDSLSLADLLMRKSIGTTKKFDIYAESSIQEICNILASSVANIFARDFSISLKPTPTKVFCDYSGVVFGEVIQTLALDVDEIMIIETIFNAVNYKIRCSMFLLPQAGSIETLNFLTGMV